MRGRRYTDRIFSTYTPGLCRVRNEEQFIRAAGTAGFRVNTEKVVCEIVTFLATCCDVALFKHVSGYESPPLQAHINIWKRSSSDPCTVWFDSVNGQQDLSRYPMTGIVQGLSAKGIEVKVGNVFEPGAVVDRNVLSPNPCWDYLKKTYRSYNVQKRVIPI